MVVSCSNLVTMSNIPDKFVEKIKTQILLSTTFLHKSAVYGIMCGKI